MNAISCCTLLVLISATIADDQTIPFVINTWPFVDATAQAWEVLTKPNNKESAALNAVEKVHFQMPLRYNVRR